MTTLDTLSVRIEIDPAAYAKFKKTIDDMARSTERAGRTMQDTFNEAGVAFRNVALAAGIAGAGVLAFALKSINAAGELGELADQLGVSTDMLQTLQAGAVESGVKVENLSASIEFFTRTIGDARQGSDNAVKAVRGLGVEFERAVASGADQDTLLRMFADRIAAIDDKSVAAAKGADLMGRGFQKLLPLFSGGSKALDEYSAQLERLGLKLTPEMIKKADDASDAIARMNFQAAQFAKTLAAEVAPAVSYVIGRLNDLITGPDISKIEKTLADRVDELRGLQEQLAGGAPRGIVEPAIKAAERDIQILEKRLEAARALRDKLEADLNARKAPTLSGGSISVGGGLVSDSEKKKAEEEFARQLKLEQAATQEEQKAYETMRDKALAQSEILYNLEFREIPGRQALLDALKQGNTAYAEEIEYQRILNQLKATGADVDETSIKLARARAKEMVALDRETERTKASMQELERFGDQAFDRIGAAMTEMAVEGKDAWRDWRNVAKGVISEVMQELIKLAAINPLKNAIFNSNTPTLGDVFGSKGGGSGLVAGGDFGFDWLQKVLKGFPFFAEGGRPPVGVPSIVGEKGPEIFVPDSAGRIIPNNQMGGGSGPIFNVDMRGASVEAVARLEKLVMRVNGSIESRAVSAITEARQRGFVSA